MKKEFENLTVCILTRNHPENLVRQLNYYSKHNIKLVILDASDAPFLQLKSSRVNYHHVADWTFHKRLIFLGEHIKTQFMVLQADDDFHGIRGLLKNLTFLENNPSYSCSQGSYIRIASQKPFIWWPDYNFQNRLKIENNELSLRVKDFVLSDMHFVYSVIATETFRKITFCFKDIEVGVLTMNELAFNFCLGIFGKYRTSPGFYSARDRSEPLSTYDFFEWADSKATSEYAQFKRNLKMVYRRYANLSENDAESFVNIILETRRERKKSQKVKDSNSVEVKSTKSLFKHEKVRTDFNQRIKKPLPFAFLRFSLWRYVFTLVQNRSLISFFLDFVEIRNVLKK